MQRIMNTGRFWVFVVVASSMLAGCAKYTTPGASADFYALGITKQQADDAAGVIISERLQRKPAAGFPTVIAVARLQGNGYSSYTGRSYGYGNFTLVTHRDVEKQEQFDRIAALPMVRGLAPLNRLVVTADIRQEEDLREAAANVFRLLREADREHPAGIAIAPIPLTGLGEAINDRLRRAAGFVG